MAGVGNQKITILKEEFPALAKLGDQEYGHILRYRIVSEDKNRFSHWSKITPLTLFSANSLPLQVAGELVIDGSSITIIWDDEVNRPRYDIFIKFCTLVNKASLTNNVAKIHTTVNHNLTIGNTILVTGISSVFNGEFVITDVTEDTISYAKTNTDISEFNVTPNGSVGLDFFYHGTSPIHTYSIIALPATCSFQAAIQIESILKERSEVLTICELSAIIDTEES
jgi:hypothetical protein